METMLRVDPLDRGLHAETGESCSRIGIVTLSGRLAILVQISFVVVAGFAPSSRLGSAELADMAKRSLKGFADVMLALMLVLRSILDS